jgi:hypothetical protein
MSEPSFLDTEYQVCFEQLRYYDTRQEELLKYLFTVTSATATAQFAVLQFLTKPSALFYGAQGFLFSVVFMASVLLYLMMLQNRLYFVFIARQINAIRKHKLKTEVPEFTDNQLYTSTSFSAFKLSSVHTMQMLGAALISALFAAVSTYGILHTLGSEGTITASMLVCITVALTEIIGGAVYLKQASKKKADKAIHQK